MKCLAWAILRMRWKWCKAVEISLALQCMKNPVPIGVGYLAQYIIKPFLGFCIAKVGVQLSCH